MFLTNYKQFYFNQVLFIKINQIIVIEIILTYRAV